jgi:hypothetical protein
LLLVLHCADDAYARIYGYIKRQLARVSVRAAMGLENCFLLRLRLVLLLLLFGRSRAGRPSVGIMYEGWHAYAYWGRGAGGITVEDVIRSNGTLTLADMDVDLSQALNFYWHKEPQAGFYCIYRKRSNEAEGCVPDCKVMPIPKS